MSATLYSGPGKVYLSNNAVALSAEGENGPVTVTETEATSDVAAAQFGHLGEQLVGQTGEIAVKPFDDWNLVPTLLPPYLGVTTASGTGFAAGNLVIGTRPHTAQGSDTGASTVWTPDGRSYVAARTAVIGHPSLHLGIGKPLYGDVKISALVALATPVVPVGNIFTITESGASDPGYAMQVTTFIRESWIGAWGSVTGFTAIQAEDEWTIECDIKYSPLKIQGAIIAYKLDSVKFMAKCKPYGPTQSQINTAVAAHTTAGQRLGSTAIRTLSNLTLTSTLSSKTITLSNAEIKGQGFLFGGTTLGTGEIGFVNFMGWGGTTAPFTSGSANALLSFSA